MDIELKAKWVNALRSGEYKQGIGKLRSCDNIFCCLGVLVDIVDPTAWVIANDGDSPRAPGYSYKGKIASLPIDVNFGTDVLSYQCDLIDMNDGVRGDEQTRKSFNEIADWIEINL